MLLDGKTVFVTGANRGIGLSCMEYFARNGANVVAHSRVERPEFLEACKNVSFETGRVVSPIFFDMTDAARMKEAVSNLISSRVAITSLVNCAGVISGGIFQMTPIEKIKEVFEVNFYGPLRLTQMLLRAIVKTSGGSVVNVGSVGGLDAGVGNTAYATSKAALMTWTKTLASELGPRGIRVNAVAPSLTQTDMAEKISAVEQEKMIRHTSLGRSAKPSEIAATIGYLISDMSSFVNGQILRVDGGVIV